MFYSYGKMQNNNINKEFYDISGNDMHADKYKIDTFKILQIILTFDHTINHCI